MAAKILPKLRVVFDLDETLVCTIPDVIGKTTFKGGVKPTVHKLILHDRIDDSTQKYNVIERPHLHAGLDMIMDSDMAKIYLFTAGSKKYAEGVLNFIDPNRKYFSKVLSGDDCSEISSRHVSCDTKDLRKLGEDYIPERTILIDDREENFFLQPENGYAIDRFYPGYDLIGSKSISMNSFDNDDHLLTACSFVAQQLLHAEDVREVLKTKFSHRENHMKYFEFDVDKYLIEEEMER